ncbi:hypothetical protein NW757_010497 [Fusarium falciforme]|nr:hypothetical protein NW757_010497 [Fusarium falciforme]
MRLNQPYAASLCVLCLFFRHHSTCPLSAGSLAVAGEESRISTFLVASSSILTTAKTVVAPRGVLSRFNRCSCPVTTPVQACAIFAPACRYACFPSTSTPGILSRDFFPPTSRPHPRRSFLSVVLYLIGRECLASL